MYRLPFELTDSAKLLHFTFLGGSADPQPPKWRHWCIRIPLLRSTQYSTYREVLRSHHHHHHHHHRRQAHCGRCDQAGRVVPALPVVQSLQADLQYSHIHNIIMWVVFGGFLKSNSHHHARHDKTVLSVSCPLRRCESDSRPLKTVADRRCEVWTRSEQLSNSHRRAGHDTDRTVLSRLAGGVNWV